MAMTGVLALLINVSGCSSSPEDLAKKLISQMNDLAEALEKNNESAAISAAKDMKETVEKLEEAQKKMNDEEKKQFKEKLRSMEDGEKAAKRLDKAMEKNPDLAKKVKEHLPK
jgi:hypothetical protein